MSTFDPVLQDEPIIDPHFPPAINSFVLQSRGELLNGLIYVANGAGPHPTAILLHGYPGNEKNLDLAQAIRRAGWNVLFFHYRGAWGSGGTYSIMNAVEDVNAAIDFVLEPETQASYRIDDARLALVGHSMGGYLALLAGSRRPEITRICSLAGVHMRVQHEQFVADPAFAKTMSAALDDTRALRGHDFAANLALMSRDWSAYDFMWRSADFRHKDVLLLAAAADTVLPPAQHHDPVVSALRAEPSVTVTAYTLDTDHAFSGKRIALTRLVVDWFNRAR